MVKHTTICLLLSQKEKDQLLYRVLGIRWLAGCVGCDAICCDRADHRPVALWRDFLPGANISGCLVDYSLHPAPLLHCTGQVCERNLKIQCSPNPMQIIGVVLTCVRICVNPGITLSAASHWCTETRWPRWEWRSCSAAAGSSLPSSPSYPSCKAGTSLGLRTLWVLKSRGERHSSELKKKLFFLSNTNLNMLHILSHE